MVVHTISETITGEISPSISQKWKGIVPAFHIDGRIQWRNFGGGGRVGDEGGTSCCHLFLSHFCLQNFAVVENLSFYFLLDN